MKSFLGQKLLFFTAHPDDESYAAAGTIYKNYQAGGSNILICATYGEKGTSHLEKKIATEKFKKLRYQELKKAAKYLHISPVHILGFPDGSVKKNQKKIFDMCLKYVKKYQPRVIVSFGRDGLSGHYDHIVIGQIARKIANKLKLTFIFFTFPLVVTKKVAGYIEKRKHSGNYKTKIKLQEPNVRIKINPTVKKRALACYASQLDKGKPFRGFPEQAVEQILRSEYFVVK